MKTKFFLIVFLMSMIFTNSYSQQDVNGWFWLNGQPTGNTLNWVKVINTSTLYAVGDRGTFMKSTDGGDTWSVNSQVGAVDNSSTGGGATRVLNYGWFIDANIGIVAGQSLSTNPGVVSRTTDGGNTWTYIQYNDTGGTVNGLYFINSTTGYLCGGSRARIFKTTDQGLNWTDLSNNVPANTYNAVYAFDENNILLTTSTNRIIKTNNAGAVWTSQTLPGSSASITDVYFKDANTGYACGNGNYFAYSVDGGANWTQSNPPSSVGQRRLKYSAGSVYLVGAFTEIYKSTDDGISWNAVNFIDGSNVNQPSPSIMFGIDVLGSDIAVVGNAGIINLSNDGGATWRNKNYSVANSSGSTLYSSMYVSSDVTDNVASGNIWLGPSGGGSLLYSSNGGTNWTNQATSHTTSVFAIDFLNSSTGFIVGGNTFAGIGQISKTTNGGNNWNLLSLPSPLSTTQLNNGDFIDENTGWVTGGVNPFTPALITKTTDGGATWTSQSVDVNPNGFGITVKMIDANTGYYLGNSGNSLYLTTNGGTNWIRNTNPFIVGVSWSNVFVYSKDIIYLNGAGSSNVKKVVRTIDGGLTWKDLTSNLLNPVTLFRTKWLNLKHGIVSGTNGYMAKTTNGGLNWTSSNPGGSTTVDCSIPNKNAWYAVSDRNSNYEVWRKYENLTSISLNVTLCIEGFWNGKPHVTDTVTIQLRNSTFPYGLVEQAREVININGFQTYEFNSAAAGSYYVVIRHRNGLETWSAAPVAVTSGGNHNYNFTTDDSQAFGNNVVLKAGQYCIYSGDINQDGAIDGSDLSIIDNDAFNFVSGYVPSDVNGDDVSDGADAVIVDNNAFNNIVVERP